MKNDKELILSLGGATAVAKMLKFKTPSGSRRVHNWMSRGIPASVKLEHPHIFLKKLKKAA